jgi:predicted DNA-binding protein (MmcQ/YjbR family)
LEFASECPRLERMDVDWLRELCLSFAGATEQIQWGYDLVFKVGGKMFAVTPLEPAPVCLSFKASPENFAELTERQNIIPAPYMARAQWVALQTRDALTRDELSRLLRESYAMVLAKLPKKMRETISDSRTGAARAGNKKGPNRKMRKKKALKKKAAKEKRARGR